MSLEGTNMYMPVMPTNGGNNFMGGDGAYWIIILFLFAFVGRGGIFGGGGNVDPAGPYIQRGFDQAAVTDALNNIMSAVSSLGQQLCNGVNTVTSAIFQGFSAAEQSANARAMADLERNYATQTAITGQMNAIAMEQANNCAEGRLAIANLSAANAAEHCNDRNSLAMAVRDIIDNQNAGFQRLSEQNTANLIAAKNDRIADLERQLMMAGLESRDVAREARLIANNEAQTVALRQSLNPSPIPAYTVPNPNCYGCSNGYYGAM